MLKSIVTPIICSNFIILLLKKIWSWDCIATFIAGKTSFIEPMKKSGAVNICLRYKCQADTVE